MRRGISLVAIVVTVMIIAVLAAVAVPYLRESNDEMAAVRTAQILRTLEQDLNNTQDPANGPSGFCVRVTVCPQQLQHLYRAITATDRSACGAVLYTTSGGGGGGQVGRWTLNAPYTGLPVSPGYGVWTPLGVIHDSVIKVATGSIELHMDSVSANAAADLDVAVDGATSPGQLTIVNTAVNTSGQVLKLVKFQITVTAGQCP
jgi:Tfp pilus assembly protein PilE